MAYRNKEDAQAYARQHYLDHKDLYKSRAIVSRPKQIEANKQWIRDYLSEHPCLDCGESDIQVLEFDHREMIGTNGKRVCAFISSRKKLEAEVEKCDVRCANCHLRRTRHQLGWFR